MIHTPIVLMMCGGLSMVQAMAVLLSIRLIFFFSSKRRHTSLKGDWSSAVCSSDLYPRGHPADTAAAGRARFPRRSAGRQRLHGGTVRDGGAGARHPRLGLARRNAGRAFPALREDRKSVV